MKQYLFEAIASFHKSKEALLMGKYGLELGWLNYAKEMISKCNSNLVSPSVKSECTSMDEKISKQIQSATRDNDLIYMDRIVEKDALSSYTGAEMTTTTPFPDIQTLTNMGYVGNMLFQGLVPFSVHKAVSVYSAKKDSRVRDLCSMIDSDNSNCLEKLTQLRLPSSLDAVRNPTGIPKLVIDRSNEMKSKGIPKVLADRYDQLYLKSQSCESSLSTTKSILDAEEAGDSAIRQQYGDRWKRKSSRDLGMIQKYGVVALITYNSFGLVSLGLCYSAVHFGIDTRPFISVIKDYAPFLIPKSSENTKVHSFFVTELILAYALHKVLFPIRIALTISTTPLVGRKFAELGWEFWKRR